MILKVGIPIIINNKTKEGYNLLLNKEFSFTLGKKYYIQEYGKHYWLYILDDNGKAYTFSKNIPSKLLTPYFSLGYSVLIELSKGDNDE